MRKLLLIPLALILVGAGCATVAKTVPFAEPFALRKGETVYVADTDLAITLKGFYFDDAYCPEGAFCIKGPEWIVKYEVRKNGALIEDLRQTEYTIHASLSDYNMNKLKSSLLSYFKAYANFQVEYRVSYPKDLKVYLSNKWHFSFNYPLNYKIEEINDQAISLIPIRDPAQSIKMSITSVEIQQKSEAEALAEIRNTAWIKIASEKKITLNNITATQLIIEDTSGVVESGVLLHYYIVPIKNATLIIKGWSDGIADSVAQSLQIYRK